MVATLNTTVIQNASSSTANITLDTAGNVTGGANLVATGMPYGSSSFLRNRIINGNFVISQYNGTNSTTAVDSTYFIDRWRPVSSAASKFTVQQNAGSVTTPVGFPNYLGCTSSSAYTVGASEAFAVGQYVEGFNWADLAWGTANAKTVTLSFQVYSSLTGTFGGCLQNSATNYSYPFSYSVGSANTWTSISVTIAGPTAGTWIGSTNGVGVRLYFSLGAGSTYSGTAGSWSASTLFAPTGAKSVVGTSGATFYITGVQLEQGSVATPFERPLIGKQISDCQRYYCKTFSLGTAPGNNVTSTGALKGASRNGSTTEPSANWKFPVSMRTEPTVTLYNTGSGTAGQWSADGAATSSANARSQWISTEGCAMDNTGTAFNNLSNIQAAASAEL
jgi:hypothetical protein